MATKFNITPVHVTHVQSLLRVKDEVIIHGDGHIFACDDSEDKMRARDEKRKGVLISKAMFGSNHHREFNSGFDERSY